MPSTARSEKLFTNIVRLRDAQRHLPSDEGLALVLADLEAELGPTVTRNLAAKLLGLSHTALRRWIDAGDLPLVPTKDGRSQIPVAVVLRLYEQLREQRNRSDRQLHVLEPVLLSGRQRAEQLDPTKLADVGDPGPSGHSRATRRARAYHAALAWRLTGDDVLQARRTLRLWQREGRIDDRYAQEWTKVLDGKVSEIQETLLERSGRADDLRQNSPFAGLLSEPERRAILEAVQ